MYDPGLALQCRPGTGPDGPIATGAADDLAGGAGHLHGAGHSPVQGLEEPEAEDEEALERLTELRRTPRATGKFSPRQWLEACRRVRLLHFRVFTFVHLFGGREREGDIKGFMESLAPDFGVAVLVLQVDLAVDPEWDLGWAPTAEAMQQSAEQGLVDGAVGGPPCSTVSRARHNTRFKGPRPVRGRGEFIWGLPGLTHYEQKRVTEANILYVFSVAFFEAISSLGGCPHVGAPCRPRSAVPELFRHGPSEGDGVKGGCCEGHAGPVHVRWADPQAHHSVYHGARGLPPREDMLWRGPGPLSRSI